MNAPHMPSWDGAMEAEFAAICENLLTGPDEELSLQQIAKLAVQTVTGADECGITLRRPDESVDAPVSTSALARRLDKLQYNLRQGPCVAAVQSGEPSMIENTATDARWPEWAAEAARLGIGSVVSVRMETAADVVGALNLYAHEIRAFDDTAIAIAQIYARHAASALSMADRAHRLEAELSSRQTIGIALGMLMQRYGLGQAQAFEALRRYAQQHDSTVSDVAARIAATRPPSAA